MQNHTMICIYVCEHSSNTDIHISNKADINKGHQCLPIKCLYWIMPTPDTQRNHTGQPFDSLYTASLQKLNTLTVSTPRSLFGIIVDLLTFGLRPLL